MTLIFDFCSKWDEFIDCFWFCFYFIYIYVFFVLFQITKCNSYSRICMPTITITKVNRKKIISNILSSSFLLVYSISTFLFLFLFKSRLLELRWLRLQADDVFMLKPCDFTSSPPLKLELLESMYVIGVYCVYEGFEMNEMGFVILERMLLLYISFTKNVASMTKCDII